MEKNYLLKKSSSYLYKVTMVVLMVALCSAQTLSSDSSSSASKKSSNTTSVKAVKSAGFFTRAKRIFFSSKPKPQQTTPQQQPQSKTSVSKTESDKTLSDVKIYPNPITDQVNLSYSLRHDANITIRIMDVLGNPVVTLLQQRLPAGNQTNSFSLSNRLTSGFYFIRVTIGTESIIKRISVL